MENKKRDPALQVPSKANDYKHINPPEKTEDDTTTANEDKKESEESRRSKHDADAGGDAPGTAGPKPDKAQDDEVGTRDEDE